MNVLSVITELPLQRSWAKIIC